MNENKRNLLDKVDRKILKELDAEARIYLKQLGAELGLTHTTMHNHLSKLLGLEIVRSCTIEVDPDFADTSNLHFYEIHTAPTNNKDLNKVTAKAYSEYLLKMCGSDLLFCMVGENNRVYVITHFRKDEDEQRILKDLERSY